jgi:hypothetical protein
MRGRSTAGRYPDQGFINPKELTDGDVSSSESCGHSEASNGG